MRVRLEATVEELEQRGDELIKALAAQFVDFDPDLAEALEKAAPHKHSNLYPRVIKDLTKITTTEYQAQLRGMLKDIGAVLDGQPLRKAFGDPPEKPEPGEEPDEKPEPGDYNPKTDEIVPEPEESEEDEGEEGEEKAKKSMPDIVAGKAGLTLPDNGGLGDAV